MYVQSVVVVGGLRTTENSGSHPLLVTTQLREKRHSLLNTIHWGLGIVRAYARMCELWRKFLLEKKRTHVHRMKLFYLFFAFSVKMFAYRDRRWFVLERNFSNSISLVRSRHILSELVIPSYAQSCSYTVMHTKRTNRTSLPRETDRQTDSDTVECCEILRRESKLLLNIVLVFLLLFSVA